MYLKYFIIIISYLHSLSFSLVLIEVVVVVVTCKIYIFHSHMCLTLFYIYVSNVVRNTCLVCLTSLYTHLYLFCLFFNGLFHKLFIFILLLFSTLALLDRSCVIRVYFFYFYYFYIKKYRTNSFFFIATRTCSERFIFI